MFAWIVSASVAIETLDFHSKAERQFEGEVMPKHVEADDVCKLLRPSHADSRHDKG